MDTKLATLTTSQLLALYNQVTGEQVKRFADRKSGLRRVSKLAEDPAMKPKLDVALGLAHTTVTVVAEEDAPLPSLGDALQEGLDKHAENAGVAPLSKPKRAKKEKKAKPVAAADAAPVTAASAGPAKELVKVEGRTVRPENVAVVKKGGVLWGSVGTPPSEKDALADKDARLNLNYPAKAVVKPMRDGTKRAKLVGVMREKGVTIAEVMKMFGLSHDQAVYKIRDLHYMSGHGIAVRGGRVFVTDK